MPQSRTRKRPRKATTKGADRFTSRPVQRAQKDAGRRPRVSRDSRDGSVTGESGNDAGAGMRSGGSPFFAMPRSRRRTRIVIGPTRSPARRYAPARRHTATASSSPADGPTSIEPQPRRPADETLAVALAQRKHASGRAPARSKEAEQTGKVCSSSNSGRSSPRASARSRYHPRSRGDRARRPCSTGRARGTRARGCGFWVASRSSRPLVVTVGLRGIHKSCDTVAIW
jgi:hypothetical protein